MAFRLPRHSEAFSRQPTGKASTRVEKPASLDWIRTLPSIVSRREGTEAAHVSYAVPAYGKLGRGKGTKESDQWAVPLTPDEHREQHHVGEHAYWASVGIDPCIIAALLYAAYPNRERAMLVISNIQRGSTFQPKDAME